MNKLKDLIFIVLIIKNLLLFLYGLKLDIIS